MPFFAFAVFFITCRNDDELPQITMEGKTTFGCLVNGQLFLPADPGGSGTHAEVFHFSDSVSVNIYAGNYISDQSMFISIMDTPDLQISKIYELHNDPCCGLQYLTYGGQSSCSYASSISGHVTLSRWDEDEGILAGTFQFSAESDECPGTVVITEGRFDIGEIAY